MPCARKNALPYFILELSPLNKFLKKGNSMPIDLRYCKNVWLKDISVVDSLSCARMVALESGFEYYPLNKS